MTKGKILGDIHQIDKDVELCRTTNERISNQAAQLLIENQIPFTRGWIKVPFFLREKYRGAHQIYVIRTNRNRYGQARRTIDQLDTSFRRRTDLKQLLIRTHAIFLHCLRHQFLKQCQELFFHFPHRALPVFRQHRRLRCHIK